MLVKLADGVTRITKVLVGLCSGVMTAVVVAEVVCRYALGSSIYWAEELSRLTFVWAGFLATSLALRRGVHASVQLAVDALPQAPRRYVQLFALAAVLFFLALIFGAALTVLPHQWIQFTPTMEIRMFWFYLAVPVGMGLMIVQLAPLMLATARGEQP
jgi:C4-dicarboxylate transporter DctQ subunit